MSKPVKKAPETEQPSKSRRTFLKKIWLGLGALLAVEYCWLIVEFLRPRRSRGEKEDTATTVVAGPIHQFEPNSVTAFPNGKFYLARLDNGGFLALHRECTHLGCTVPWDAQANRFVCPCHASAYDITGDVLSPPAPRALDLFAVRIENGIVKVDTSKRIKRKSFEGSQVTAS
jgi:cytochrome b6-f complex iron-sulfur subunit